jgi:hypothetical protein
MELPYLAYFNLKEEPFSTVPSPRYFFLTATHSEVDPISWTGGGLN